MQLSDEHLETFHEPGFVVIENYYPEKKRASIAAAIRESHPPWEIMKDREPEKLSPPGLLKVRFPYNNVLFNDPDGVLAGARRAASGPVSSRRRALAPPLPPRPLRSRGQFAAL